MKMKQVHLQRKDRNQILWVEANPKIKAGNSMSLKGSPEFWNIKQVYEREMDKDAIPYSWHVGGL